jgi:hypothetical protein
MSSAHESHNARRFPVAGIGEDEVFDHLRSEDGEHVGYIGITADDLFVPYDLLHRRRGEPGELDEAEAVLDEVGLHMLAEDWLLRVADADDAESAAGVGAGSEVEVAAGTGAGPAAEAEPGSVTGAVATWVAVRIREVTRGQVVVNRLLDDAPSHIAKAMDLTHDVVLDLPTDRLMPRD